MSLEVESDQLDDLEALCWTDGWIGWMVIIGRR